MGSEMCIRDRRSTNRVSALDDTESAVPASVVAAAAVVDEGLACLTSRCDAARRSLAIASSRADAPWFPTLACCAASSGIESRWNGEGCVKMCVGCSDCGFSTADPMACMLHCFPSDSRARRPTRARQKHSPRISTCAAAWPPSSELDFCLCVVPFQSGGGYRHGE